MDMFPNAGAAAAAPPADDGKMVDLTDTIDKERCYARNEASGFPLSNLFIGDSRLGCKSDTDEQLIIHIAFHDFVKVSAVIADMMTSKADDLSVIESLTDRLTDKSFLSC